MSRFAFRRLLVGLAVPIYILAQSALSQAGTTGGLSGTDTRADNGAPIADATVTASSPSQAATTKTDATGHFLFISLAPDTYTVTAEKQGFQTVSQSGLTVTADATRTVALKMVEALKEIGSVTSRVGLLVKPGTTADVYSVNALTQDKASALGGGGSLNSAYSAIASVPGAYVPLNQTGYFQTVHIRGGDYDQVGYEFDGVPVNRSFDNFPSGGASSLGQQELQVYTGASPANSESEGLAGYVNQVIKTGTFPGYATAYLGLGTPVFYHKAAIETGGASPNRNFSYYLGLGGYDQEYRYVDSSNAAGFSQFGTPLSQMADPGFCADPFTAFSECYNNSGGGGVLNNFAVGPGGYQLLPYQYGFLNHVSDRDVVMNVHIGIPHKYDGGKDDIQLLWDSAMLFNSYYSSTSDAGGPSVFANGALPTGDVGAVPFYSDSYQYTCPVGVTANVLQPSCVTNYFYPSSPTGRQFQSNLLLNDRDVTWNNQEIVKLQYQKNFGSDAFLRIYGYTYYSDWLNYGPQSAMANYVGTGASPDYELSAHTRGVSAEFSRQMSPQHLLTLQGSYTTSNTIRDNNTQMFNTGGTRANGIVLVSSANPYNGVCYDGGGNATTCDPSIGDALFVTWSQLANNGGPIVPFGTCGGSPCTFLIAENSQYATYNTVRPIFTSYSIQDQWRPSDRLLLNLGLRLDNFQFNGSDTGANDPARQFWFTAWNLDHCINNVTGRPADKIADPELGLSSPTDPCPAGWSAANLQNISGQVQRYNVLQPRLGGTYTLNPDTVLRFSFGRYVEPPSSAFEQYNTLQENLPGLIGTAFYKFGFTTPGHEVRPPISYNYDISLEKHLKGTDWTFKFTPFLRKTRDQIQQFFLDQATAFVSGLNVGRQTSEGFELQVSKGDFASNGWSGLFSFAYTYSYIHYDTLANGASPVSGINADIGKYNSLTQAGGGAACYDSIGNPDPLCSAGTIANPYFKAPMQPLLDPGANYPTYDIFPGPIGSSAQGFNVPYVASMILNYKHDKWAITPSLQFAGGARYGAPESTPGIDPTAGCGALTAPGATTIGDPRYPYGAAGGSPYDAVSCSSTIVIPNPYTGKFDALGTFVQPNQLVANVQVSYDINRKITLVGTFANVINRCWGGTKQAWTVDSSHVCSYGVLPNAGSFGPVGNVYNWSPTQQTPIQRFVQYPYAPYLGAVNVDGNSTQSPFNMYLEARIKI